MTIREVRSFRSFWLAFGLHGLALPAAAASFYIDPVNGSEAGDGSASAPWRSLQSVLDNGRIESRDWPSYPYTAGMSLKVLFGRPRPSVVTHLSHVSSLSFPSVHSMMSAVVFITIGLLLSEMTTDRRVRVLLLAAPLCLTLLVGFSRVCMGVHYPTDVLAGWGVGLGWTWTAFQLRHRWQNAKV